MNFASDPTTSRKLVAYVLPMVVFLGSLALVSGLKTIGGPFWLASPEYWVYPLQTICCAAVLFWFRSEYDFARVAGLAVALGVGVVVFVLWISPQAFFGSTPRTDGFNPDTFAANPPAYWCTVIFRFLRLAVVVPLVEEIFWRGFLLRYFIDEKFTAVPLGKFSWLSFAVVTIGFMLVHSPADWPAAFVTGVLYNCVAYWTKSLLACVLAHATTNLLLGLWIMQSKQWGFW